MKSPWILKLSSLALSHQIFAQGILKLKGKEDQEIVPGIYEEIVLEDFSHMPFRQNLSTASGAASVQMSLSKLYPPPFYGAQNYVKLEIQSSGSEAIQLFFEKTIEVKKQIQTFFLWVYSTMLPGDLWLLIKDTRGEVHYVSFGKLNFRGWKKLKADVPNSVVQQDLTPMESLPVRILQIIYRPGPEKRRKMNQIIFLDHLTAKVREKYLLPSIESGQ